MGRILNFGSMNIDHVYQVEHFVRPGETISSLGYEVFPGGKGLNQSVALAKGGGQVYHAGRLGGDGAWLADLLAENGVDISLLKTDGSHTGHAIIQVNAEGQNCILLHGGANGEITTKQVVEVLSGFGAGDLLVLQNEINQLEFIIDTAYGRGMQIALNPSPINHVVLGLPLEKVAWFLLNEVEGRELTGEVEPERILDALMEKYPKARVVLTLGKQGVVYRDANQRHSHGIYRVPVVDTTAAGDTFTGFFLSAVMAGVEVPLALRRASIASSLAVSKQGAAVSIPTLLQVEESNLQPM